MDELEFKLRTQKWDLILRVALSLIKFGTIAAIAWQFRLGVEAVAGRETVANFALALVADLKANSVISHLVLGLVGATGAGYGLRQRNLRRKDIQRLGNRVVELEKRMDSRRSSSSLTVDGRSRPEDEP
jgi:hypothetical protein